MKPALIELQYLPSVRYFQLLAHYPLVLIEQHEHFTKGSYRNRCHIAGANGIIRLSIPLLKGKNQQCPIKEVELAYYEPWPAQHWGSVRSAYGRAPFFEEYADILQPLFEAPGALLFDFNWKLLHTLSRLLQLPCEFRLTESYEPSYPSEVLDDFRNTISPKAPPASLNRAYPQLFEDRHGFLPDLSILDLLFCMGPEAAAYLRAS